MTNEQAIDELNNIKKYNYTLMPTEALNMAIEALSAQQWIPCSERLPEECQSVLIYLKRNGEAHIDVSYRTDYNRWERYGRDLNVIAWMPLPEPYKGGDTDDE